MCLCLNYNYTYCIVTFILHAAFLLDHLNVLLSTSVMSHFYFPRVQFLNILYIHIQIWNTRIFTIFLNVILFHIYISSCYVTTFPVNISTNLKYIKCIFKCNTAHISIFPMFCHYKSCIYSYRLWNVLNVLLIVLLSHIHISLMFCCYISCIYSYRLWNILLTVILSYIYFFPMLYYYLFCI